MKSSNDRLRFSKVCCPVKVACPASEVSAMMEHISKVVPSRLAGARLPLTNSSACDDEIGGRSLRLQSTPCRGRLHKPMADVAIDGSAIAWWASHLIHDNIMS